MRRALAAAAAYFAIVFALAFLLGVARTLFVAPRVGELVAVLIEAPIVLLISWRAAGWSIRRFSVTARASDRATMGLAAFLLLMTVETTMSLVLFDRPLAQQFAAWATAAGAIGLLAQAAYGLIPLLAVRRR
ncbi:hypothetical protein [Brevundimonas sp. UBA7664]|uniref:hypothetical protein n=1 Tax=Brevundimonas sp. UBA7664 TaxID=1946141 RepID=UPI0025BF7AB6|nr:hypothetical protein [Brevundimonas sp. UBA7664]